MKNNWHLENTYATLPQRLFSLQHPVKVAEPETVYFNETLAQDLGLGFLNEEKESIANYFSGNLIPEGAEPLAQAYAGHQFGHFNRLGDGRAVLLGEQVDPAGNRFDIQLKGSGRTPYSRRGDGRATLYSMLREYLISEAMHHLDIPTTRSLAVVSTGEQVYRETPNEGAVLTRIAASHIRVGTFEYVGHFGAEGDLAALANYTIERHYPALAEAENPPLELLKTVMHKLIDLVVDWMRVGFIHGVMNTDNISIAGETIDYGPCAFMNAYSPKTVFSSIDTNGRYAFGNQPYIAQWNLTVFANALLPLIADDHKQAVALAQETIDGFQASFSEKWYAMMMGKLGVIKPTKEDKPLVNELLTLMEAHKVDYTQMFLTLQQDNEAAVTLIPEEGFKGWLQKWERAQLRGIGKSAANALMDEVNPKVIPRNHWVENALTAATEGDLAPFHQLLDLLSNPYDSHPDELQFQPVPESFDAGYRTFCGT